MSACLSLSAFCCLSPHHLLRSKPTKRISLELDVLLVAMLEKLCHSGNTQVSPNSSSSSNTMHGFHLCLKNFCLSPIKPHQPSPKCHREKLHYTRMSPPNMHSSTLTGIKALAWGKIVCYYFPLIKNTNLRDEPNSPIAKIIHHMK